MIGILLMVLAASAAFAAALYYLLRRSPGRTTELLLLVFSAGTFVFLGVGAINTMTNGRGAPEETAPWFALIAIAAIAAYYRFGRRSGSPARTAQPRVKAEQRAAPFATPAGAQAAPASSAGSSGALFISYRRADSADVTGRIYDRLLPHFGKASVFKDVDSIPLGVDFREHLSSAVGQCRVLLAIIGRNWLAAEPGATQRRIDNAGDFVRIEIEAALERNIAVIPVLVQGASLPSAAELPAALQALSYRNAIAVRPDPDFHQDVARLIKGIEAHLA